MIGTEAALRDPSRNPTLHCTSGIFKRSLGISKDSDRPKELAAGTRSGGRRVLQKLSLNLTPPHFEAFIRFRQGSHDVPVPQACQELYFGFTFLAGLHDLDGKPLTLGVYKAWSAAKASGLRGGGMESLDDCPAMIWPLPGSFSDDLLNLSKPALAQYLLHVVVFLKASQRDRVVLQIRVLLRPTPPSSKGVGNVRTVEDGDAVEATSSAYLCRTESFSATKLALPWPWSAWTMAAKRVATTLELAIATPSDILA